VTLDFSNSTIFIDPENGANSGYYPITISSTQKPSGFGSPQRTPSHLHGQITPSTTQLTMDPSEIVDVQPGEVVAIWGGVNSTSSKY
jgi:hypothetical protein